MRTYATLATMLVLCGSALGQNALDKPLDKNPRVGSGGVNQNRTSLAEELRLRNAIVTGNAPGGFSFRGDVGYRAPGEFFGSLGSNENFSFRRDSYYSGLGGLGIRGTDALQYQFAMTTGNAPPAGFQGSPTYSRSGSAIPVRTIETGPQGEKLTPDSGLRREPVDDASLMSLRSPSAFASSRSLEPMMLGRHKTPDGRVIGVSASPLLGLTATEQQQDEDKPKASISEQISGRVTDKKDPINKQDNRVETEAPASAYDELMTRIKSGAQEPDKPADPTKDKPAWQVELDELRKQLGTSPTKDDRPKREIRRTDTRPPIPGEVKPGETKPGETKPGETKPGEAPDKTQPKGDLDPTAIERIRNAAGNVRDLAAKGFNGYAEHMSAAQQHIAAGRFFYAEERFTAALSLKPGDPMAAIGRVHAQLGAGMFLSAAINLRSLFTEHPEVVSLKYQASLLPPADRIRVLEERLVELAKPRDGKHRDLGLLIAYLGFQQGKPDGIRQGLGLMAEAPPAQPDKPAEGPDQLQKLSSLLSQVWLKPTPTPPAEEPKPAPEPNK